MAGPLGAFALFALLRLAQSVRLGASLGTEFSQIRFLNLLQRTFPELSRSQVGHLARAARFAGTVALSQTGLPSPLTVARGLIPVLHGLANQMAAGNRYRYGISLSYRVHGESLPFGFTTIIDSSSPLDMAAISSLAGAALEKAMDDSPTAFGFESSEVTSVTNVQIDWIIQST